MASHAARCRAHRGGSRRTWRLFDAGAAPAYVRLTVPLPLAGSGAPGHVRICAPNCRPVRTVVLLQVPRPECTANHAAACIGVDEPGRTRAYLASWHRLPFMYRFGKVWSTVKNADLGLCRSAARLTRRNLYMKADLCHFRPIRIFRERSPCPCSGAPERRSAEVPVPVPEPERRIWRTRKYGPRSGGRPVL